MGGISDLEMGRCKGRKGAKEMKKPKPKNYIDKRGHYINVEKKSLKEIWLDGYEAGRRDKSIMDIADHLREADDGK